MTNDEIDAALAAIRLIIATDDGYPREVTNILWAAGQPGGCGIHALCLALTSMALEGAHAMCAGKDTRRHLDQAFLDLEDMKTYDDEPATN